MAKGYRFSPPVASPQRLEVEEARGLVVAAAVADTADGLAVGTAERVIARITQ